MAAFFKACTYVGFFGTVSYILLQVAQPSDEKKQAIQRTGFSDPSSNESKIQKALFLEKLKQAAATDKPIHLKKPSSVDPASSTAEKTSEVPRQPSKREIN